MRSRTVLVALMLMVCSVSAFDYAMGRVGQPNRELLAERLQAHLQIVHGEAPSPYRYRVLAPILIHAVALPAGAIVGYERAFHATSALFYLCALVGLLLVLKAYLETWFSGEHALIGTLLVASTLPIVLRQHIYAPWSWLEPTLLTLALLWIVERRTARIVALTIVASLNRETAVLIPLAYGIDALYERPRSKNRLLTAGALAAVSVAVIVTLRLSLGAAPPIITLAQAWTFNLSADGLLKAAVNGSLFFGVTGWLLAAYGFRSAPVFVKRMSWLIAVYLPLYIVGGIWYEVRLLMPLYPILVPSLMSAVEWYTLDTL